MWRLIILSVLLVSAVSVVKTKQIDQQKIVDRHNYYRKMVNVPNLEYSKECANKAQIWAEKLAKKIQG